MEIEIIKTNTGYNAICNNYDTVIGVGLTKDEAEKKFNKGNQYNKRF